MSIKQWEREYLRDYAKEQLEISNLPIMAERARLWTLHNDCKIDRPMVHFEMHPVLDREFFRPIKCETPEARDLEKRLEFNIHNHLMVDDDRVVTPDYQVDIRAGIIPFDMEPKRENTDGLGFHIVPQIENLEDMSLIKPSPMIFNCKQRLEHRDLAEDIFGDILDVRLSMSGFYFCMTNEIVQRMSMENMFFAMYDTPNEFKAMMDSLSNDYIAFIRELEKRELLVGNNKNDWVAQGTFGFTEQLPDRPKTSKDCWGFMDSQETVAISSEMFGEFVFPYYQKIADNFGRLVYGCCEPVDPFFDKYISKFNNLSKLSISAWANEEYMGERLAGTNIIYQRKPSPNYVGVGKNLDEEAFRAHIKKTVDATKKCKLEITFRDVVSLEGNISKPRRAVEIAREELEKR